MWNAGGSQNAGGGFLDNSQFDSPSDAKKEPTVRRAQNLVNVTVQQVLSSPTETLKIGRIDVNLVRLVARVKSVEVSSTKIKYELEDDTGRITAISWLDGDSDDSEKGPLVECTYCNVVGSIRAQEGRRYLMLLLAEPLKDANMLTTHLLNVIHHELMANLPPKQPAGDLSMGAGTSGMQGVVKMEPGGSTKDRVLVFIQGYNHTDAGVNKTEIMKAFSKESSARQIDEALEFLCNEGQIYTTVDDDHYRSTE